MSAASLSPHARSSLSPYKRDLSTQTPHAQVEILSVRKSIAALFPADKKSGGDGAGAPKRARQDYSAVAPPPPSTASGYGKGQGGGKGGKGKGGGKGQGGGGAVAAAAAATAAAAAEPEPAWEPPAFRAACVVELQASRRAHLVLLGGYAMPMILRRVSEQRD